ncbi:hypothetical protein TrVE_jg10655 [Triparma verrucosa]|uniref:Tyrosine-protein kinase ephrin type A/B receptor-like domain-containing protein n=1 Tax=Triparma verrucosa TaxID=1606542 RepID=A0A9W7CK33_9STRA|nr:hypothetical protein TrVE_jg10655 [Triparma verrucosa]
MQGLGSSTLVNLESSTVSWKLTETSNPDSLSFQFINPADDTQFVDGTEYTVAANGYKDIGVRIDPHSSASTLQGYTLTCTLSATTSPGVYNSAQDTVITYNVYITADATSSQSQSVLPTTAAAGSESVLVKFAPYDHDGIAVTHTLTRQDVTAVIRQNGESDVSCTLIYYPFESTWYYQTSSCLSSNEMRGGVAQLDLIMTEGMSQTIAATGSLELSCPDTLMTATGTDGYCECPKGYYNTGTKCDVCGSGKYCPNRGMNDPSQRLDCPYLAEGYITTANETSWSINHCVCPTGLVITDESTRECKCPPGTFVENDLTTGLKKCTACPADNFQDANHKDMSCIECSSMAGKNDKQTHTDGVTGSTSVEACVCTEIIMTRVGTSDGKCGCPAGYSFECTGSGPSETCSCQPCAIGSYKSSTSSDTNEHCAQCDQIDVNTHTTSIGSTSVSDCVCALDTMGVISGGSSDGKCGCPSGYCNSVPKECSICGYGTFNDHVNVDSACQRCTDTSSGGDVFTNTTALGSTSRDSCVCYDENHVLDSGSCGCDVGHYWDVDEAMCTVCATDYYAESTDPPSFTKDMATGEIVFNNDDVCVACTTYDPNSWTNGTIGATNRTTDCICMDVNMDKMDDGMCGCKPGYYYVPSSGSENPSCAVCPADEYSSSISLDETCSSCYVLDEHSYTNGTTGVGSEDGCICHTEDGFHHDPNYDLASSDSHFAPCVCGPGRYYSAGTLSCEECEIGTYQPDHTLAATDCESCEDDNAALDFTGLKGAVTVSTGTEKPDGCLCYKHFFDAAHACMACTPGMTCDYDSETDDANDYGFTVATLVVEEGYWRPYNDSTHVYECLHAESCSGSVNSTTADSFGDALCLEGHTGAYCEVCIQNSTHEYAKDAKTGECILCDADAHGIAMTVAIVCFTIFVALFCYITYRTAKAVTSTANSTEGMTKEEKELEAQKKIAEAKGKVAEMKAKMDAIKAKKDKYMAYVNKARAAYKSARTPLKILVSFSQIVSGLPQTLDMKFPVNFTELLHKINFVNVDLGGMAAESCLMVPNFYQELVAMTMGPIICGGTLILVFFCCNFTRDPFFMTIGEEIFKLFLLGTYLVMPGATVKIFTTFRCDEKIFLDGDGTMQSENNGNYGMFLIADYRRKCYDSYVNDQGEIIQGDVDPMYRFYFWYAVAMIFVFPIGITSLYSIILYRNRFTIDPGQDELAIVFGGADGEERALSTAIKIRDDGPHSKNHKKYAFLYEAYEPKCWWFEIFECFRRLGLTAGLIMLRPGTAIQIATSMVLCLLSMRVYAYAQPYISDRDDILAEIMQWQIFFTMFGSLLMKVDLSEEGAGKDVFGTLLLFVNAVGPGMLVCNSIYNGDMKAKLFAKIAKAKGQLEKAQKILFCFKGRIGAVIAMIEEKESGLDSELGKKRGLRPEKYDVKDTLKDWQKQEEEKEEKEREKKLEEEAEEGGGEGNVEMTTVNSTTATTNPTNNEINNNNNAVEFTAIEEIK